MGVARAVFERLAMTEVISLLVALLCMLGQVTGMPPRSTCGVDARPHKDGICGESLIRARNLLCYLLYENYPDRFGNSRPSNSRYSNSRFSHSRFSNNDKRSIADIFSYPVEAFAKMSLSGHEDDLQKVTESAVSPTEDSEMYLPMLPKYRSTLPRPLPSAAPTHGSLISALATKRAPEDPLPHVSKRGLVCDCCYNKCLPSILARYC